MFGDAIAKLGKDVRRLGVTGEALGKEFRAVCEGLEEALGELHGGSVPKRSQRRPARRARPVPPPSRPVSELDQARAERELKRRGLVIGEE
jgi:hypothetical protein